MSRCSLVRNLNGSHCSVRDDLEDSSMTQSRQKYCTRTPPFQRVATLAVAGDVVSEVGAYAPGLAARAQ
jgi:hypothetical protein